MLTLDDIKTGVDAIKVLIDVTKFLKGLLPKAEARDRRLQENIVHALRVLYFTPTGILSLLQEVVDGNELTDSRIRQALGEFNDREWRIADALRLISRAELHRELGVSLETVRALDVLGSGKAGLRRAVQDEVNLYGQKDVKPNKAAARRLITAIRKLNTQIESIDGVVNPRARSGHGMTKRAKTRTPKKKAAAKKTARKPSKR